MDLLSHYPVVMTGNHPEYWSTAMFDALETWQGDGGRLMYMGGNGFFSVTSFHAQLPGLIEVTKVGAGRTGMEQPDRSESRHASDGADPGGLWVERGRSVAAMVGVVFDSVTLVKSAPYERLPDSHDPRAAFIFDGVDANTFGDYGVFGNGASGSEYDKISYAMGTPAHALQLARGTKGWNNEIPGRDPLPGNDYGADMVFFELPKGGAVFSTGSMAWVGALSHNHYRNDIARITENVLRRFLDESPLQMPEKSSQ